MNREELQNLIAPFYPALLLDAIISRRKRKIVRKILTVTLLIFIFVNLLTRDLNITCSKKWSYNGVWQFYNSVLKIPRSYLF